MKLQIVNDLHCEFNDYKYTLDNAGADALILAGDIGVGFKGVNWAIENLAHKFEQIFYVPGNHEYYHQDITELDKLFENLNRDGFQILQPGKVFLYKDKTFTGATLWTDIGDWYDTKRAQKYMNDFRIIRKGGAKFTAHRAKLEHEMQRILLLNTAMYADVVITHHAPTHKCVQPRFIGNPLNGCFAANCDDIIEKLQPQLWVHGHMHDTIDFMYNDITRIVCNPKGYDGVALNPNFNPNFIVEII